MIFDKICNIIEDRYPNFTYVLKKSKIFVLDDSQIKIFFDDTKYGEDFDERGFYFPYPICAMEMDKSCVIFEDLTKNQRGFSDKRKFYFDVGFRNKDKIFENLFMIGEFSRDYQQDAMLFDYLHVEIIKSNDEIITMDPGEQDLDEKVLSMINSSLRSCLEIFRLINQPENFILETRPTKIKSNPKKIPRSHQRPLYTILHPKRIREQMRLPHPGPTGTGKSKAPHERRRHERFLSDDKFKWDLSGRPIEPKKIPYGPRKGQPYFKKIDVPATWIGPTQSQVGNKIYRVILDK